MKRGDRLDRLFLALCRFGLLAFPRDFRRQFGDEMIEVWKDRRRAASADGGRLAVAILWLTVPLDCWVQGISERLERRAVAGQRAPVDPSPSPLVDLGQDLRVAARALLRRPGLTAAVGATLAVGLGATILLFAIVDHALLRPLPIQEPDRVVLVANRYNTELTSSSPPDFIDRRDLSRSFSRVAAYTERALAWLDSTGPEQVDVVAASEAFFPLLGVPPLHGSTVFPAADGPEARLAVLSHAFWLRRLGGDPDAVGRSFRLGGETVQVLGIMPPAFDFPHGTDLWIPLHLRNDQLTEAYRPNEFLTVLARLGPGISLQQASDDMTRLTALAVEAQPGRKDFLTRSGFGAAVLPLGDVLTREVRPALLALLGAVALVLILACANVGHVLLVRASTRKAEMAVRRSLGAGRWRLVRLALTESLWLAVAGTAAGLAIAHVALEASPLWLPDHLPALDNVAIDPRVAGFAVVLALVTGLVAGILPAWRSADDASHLRTRSDLRGRRWRSALVIGEVALALSLFLGASFLLDAFTRLASTDPGFEAEGRLAFRLTLPASDYPSPERRLQFHDELTQTLQAHPQIERVALADRLPLDNRRWTATFHPEGYEPPGDEPAPGAEINIVSPHFFAALDIELRAGRFFDNRDHLEAERAVIIDAVSAARFWPQGAVGRRINLNGADEPPAWRQVIGVVAPVHVQALGQVDKPQLYFAASQVPPRAFTVVLETLADDPLALAGAVRSTVGSLAPTLPVAEMVSVEALVSRSIALERFAVGLAGAFAAVALVLSMIGLYGVLAYAVSCRTAELGIRMALGAPSSRLARGVLREGLTLAVVGAALGALLALTLGRPLAGLIAGVDTADPAIWVVAIASQIAVALVASLVPAIRALRLDPVRAMKRAE